MRFELISADVLHSFWFPALVHPIRLSPDNEKILDLDALPAERTFGSCDAGCGCKGVCMRFQVSVDNAVDLAKWAAEAGKDQYRMARHSVEPPPCVRGNEHMPKAAGRPGGVAELLGDG